MKLGLQIILISIIVALASYYFLSGILSILIVIVCGIAGTIGFKLWSEENE